MFTQSPCIPQHPNTLLIYFTKLQITLAHMY
nr:MAG TPA: hypothetical protein [Caudoviricetes sp.]